VRDKVVREIFQRDVLRLSPEVRAEVTDAIRVRDEKGSGWTF
jgi:hypothetical protein